LYNYITAHGAINTKHVMLFRTLNVFCTVISALPEECVQCAIWLYSALSLYFCCCCCYQLLRRYVVLFRSCKTSVCCQLKTGKGTRRSDPRHNTATGDHSQGENVTKVLTRRTSAPLITAPRYQMTVIGRSVDGPTA